ncbi:hypothetical protein E1262_03695 [Jiangella aurantiaca]|uniref:DUF3558 domain-containing protein n=1 Tax=Jiangella aurantiaca TaxID=2530373 RepID=A0A4R5AIE2_9ACTN|nr:hypothetical protein [Jiangella aurantiaca]TDD72413.1 hypothetical protein E1262_03695 [Jiangella aurantiaca]
MKVLAALTVGLLLVTSGCSGGPARLYEAESGGGRGIYDTRPGRPYAFEEMTLCLDEPGSVVVTDVSPIEPMGGFEVLGFSVRPVREGQGLGHLEEPTQRLAAGGYPVDGPMVVDDVCPDDESGEGGTVFNLGIEVDYSAPDAGTASGFLVIYESGGESLTLVRPFGVSLCAARQQDPPPPECEIRIVAFG